MKRKRHAFTGAGIIFLLLAFSLVAPALGLQDANVIPSGHANEGPSADHWLGTDQLGRDLLARLVEGAQRSLMIGVVTAVLATVIGLCVGTVSGWYSRTVDRSLMHVTEIALAFPTVLLAACLVAALGRDEKAIILALSLALWPVVARVARTRVSEIRSKGFVEAAQVSGASAWWNIRHHVVPHTFPVVLPIGVAMVATAMIGEATLAFLGLGVAGDAVSWGTMAVEGRAFITTQPQLVLLPACGIAFSTMLVMVVSDSLVLEDRH